MTATDARRGATGVTVVVLAVAAVAWLSMAWLHAAPATNPAPDAHHGHDHAAGPGTEWLVRAAGWVLMVVAMMLPPALPLLHTARRLGAAAHGAGRVVAATALGFVGVWALSGVGYQLLDGLAGATVAAFGLPSTTATTVGVAVALLAAGAYQLSPAKQACLTACRSPQGMAMTRWSGRHPARDGLRIGGAYALVCVGCCWALMLLTLVAGVAAMAVMVPMTVLMAAERLIPRTRPLVPAVAAALLAAVPVVLLWPHPLS